jgi:hypothetical protein
MDFMDMKQRFPEIQGNALCDYMGLDLIDKEATGDVSVR